MAAEGTYEYECMRAELLGLERPDYEEFTINKAARDAAEEDQMEVINLEDADTQNESYSQIGGRLDELNSILKSTQRKIHNFKTYGFVLNLFKTKAADKTNSSDSGTSALNKQCENVCSDNPALNMEEEQPRSKTDKTSDLAKAIDRHVDVLDSLIEQTEKAQYSMAYQNREMKKFLK
ncbi:uncharacterized protein LOC132706260 [Cylas formicarius]|uniref:uncharacterized protein LOC132706260 n=1 Tax=Cylas formicarius TaxID=197179 RepID=UPI00295886C0|nr:uncharacterized protein LOC132706260 [Cylas formicarius]